MNFVYHLVPKYMRGDVLYPLNDLKTIFPKLYDKKVKKYKGREFLMKETIPFLSCLWNDVLHFSAVSPYDIKKAFVECGYPLETKFYKIDTTLFDAGKAIVYLFNTEGINDKLEAKNFEKYNPKNFPKYSQFPYETKEYYKKELEKGKWPLLFYKIPHILFKGSINIKDMPIIKV